jgi:hypothetical protein
MHVRCLNRRSRSAAASVVTMCAALAGPAVATASTYTDVLPSGSTLAAGDRLASNDGHFELLVTSGGDLVERVTDSGRVLWHTGTASPGARVAMQASDSHLVELSSDGRVLWASSAYGPSGGHLALGADANLAVVRDSGAAVWASGAVDDRLAPGEALRPGQRIVSPSREYAFVQQPDGNDVAVVGQSQRPYYQTATAAHAGASIRDQADGNIVITAVDGAVVFNTGTQDHPATSLVMQDDSQLVAYWPGGAVWASHQFNDRLAPGETLYAGFSLTSADGRWRLNDQTDGNLTLTAIDGASLVWNNGMNGRGAVRYMNQASDGNIVGLAGSTPVWATGAARANSLLVLQSDRNLVVYPPSGVATWASHTAVTDGGGGANGPQALTNSSIADNAESHPDGSTGGQCLVFVENEIAAAGGPQWAFGLDTSRYQALWASRATQIGAIGDAKRGDIIQWGGGAGGNLLHTAIITQGGTDPSLIDSNWGNDETVHRGTFSSRNAVGSVYQIWRVGRL